MAEDILNDLDEVTSEEESTTPEPKTTSWFKKAEPVKAVEVKKNKKTIPSRRNRRR